MEPPAYEKGPPPSETTPMMGAHAAAAPSVSYVTPSAPAPCAPTIISVPCLSECPTQVTCPACHQNVVTRTTYTPGALTWLICLVICFFGGFLGCCLIPFCVDACQDVVHSCPICNSVVGRFKRL